MIIDRIRNAYHVREGYWFAPKAYGIGATPATWQGWALTAGFCVIIIALAALIDSPDVFIAISLVLALLFVAIAWAKTDGGWRWRWGGK